MESKTKHVRSASLRAIAAVDPVAAKRQAEMFLRDKAYEVREAAAQILGVPVP
jgi:hypothetical protein